MFTVIDIETTGLSKNYHQITEIAAAKVINNEIVDTYQTLINPQTRIPPFITKLTGINNQMVKDAPLINDALPSFIKFLGKDIFVAHNATFDYGFLEHNLMFHNKHQLLNPKICTRKLANRLFPELPRKRLGDLCDHLRIKNTQAHRAMGDVLATTQVFNNMMEILNSQGITEIKDVLKFEKSCLRRI
ncbi:MAG: 3'-5' exonuclease [Candidatus Woesearchaeota archaeon]